MNRWIKLYEKINENDMIRDPHAIQLFIWLLTNADKDGVVEFGRYRLARELRVNNNTLYSTLRRLVQKYKCCTQLSTTNKTEIRLLNWDKYQSSKESVNHETTMSQPRDNTINKNKNNTYIQLTKGQKAKLEKEFPTVEVLLELEKFTAWQKANNKTFPNVLERFRLWLMDCRDKQNQTPLKSLYKPVSRANPIISDPMFKSYLEVYHASDDNEMRKKMGLENLLNQKYSTFKYSAEWSEARKLIPKFN